eukprot:scaffold4847_cov265-Pinguiococcus_pyrenoidosus.AAC.8
MFVHFSGARPFKPSLYTAWVQWLRHVSKSGAPAALRAAFPARNSCARLLAAAGVFGWASGLSAGGAGEHVSQSCGIVGFVSNVADGVHGEARGYLLEGLSILRSRGYDSAGIATLSPLKELVVRKFASRGSTADSIDLLRQKSDENEGHFVGIAHTRWATHGGKTDANAHPHMDAKERIALVHNGTINNAGELRKELAAAGIVFKSETDTEVIAKLIGVHLDHPDCKDLRDATARALKRCDGTWGIAVLSKDSPDEIVVACNGSPLAIGLGADRAYVASETAAFSKYTKNFIALQDGEIGVVKADGSGLDLSRVESAPDQDILLSPEPYPHWTIRECLEQPQAIARALAFGGRLFGDRVVLGGMDRAKDRLEPIRNLLISGCGTSLNAGLYGAKLMRALDCFDTVTAIDAAEVTPDDLPRHHGGLLAISQSGETRDVFRSVREAEAQGMTVFSVVNAVGSLIARTTRLGVYLNAGRENAVASTKAFTSQVTALALIALWFRQQREDSGEESLADKSDLLLALQRLPISFGMALRTREQCFKVAEMLQDKEHLFILGKGFAEPIAYEGALKIKEIGYLNAQGYSGGALKHGPFALIEGRSGKHGPTPIIMIILDDEHAPQMLTAAHEVQARGAEVVVITDNAQLVKEISSDPIVIPSNGPLTALISVLPLQLIAYELSVLRGINPDTPRNLAKAVTVD